MLDNYFAIEPLLQTRLEQYLYGVPVLTSADFNAVDDKAQPAKAVHVIYAGDNISNDPAQKYRQGDGLGHEQQVTQIWMIMLAVRNVRKLGSGAPVNQDAGALMMQIIKALSGWVPIPGESQPLTRLKGTQRTVYQNGFAYYSMPFTTEIITNNS